MSSFIQRRGIMLVLSSPSGAGKTSVSRALLEREKNLFLSVSCTTRMPRPGEKDGEDYFFVSENEYTEKVRKSEFLEHAKVFGNYYGTLKESVEGHLRLGEDVLFDIDWQGTQQLIDAAREDVVSIFILPPSIQILNLRIKNRGQDSSSVMRKRMEKASDEMSHWPEYDYIIVNDILEDAINCIHSILIAERLRRFRLSGVADFVNSMRENV